MSLLREIGYASAAILKTLVGPMLGKDELIDSVGYVVSNGPPTSVVPDFIGQHLYDSSTPTWYKAHGVAAGQWTLSGVPSNVVLAQTDPVTGGMSLSAGANILPIPTASGIRTILIGDSYIDREFNYTTDNRTHQSSWGSIVWANFLLGSPLNIVKEMGIGGERVSDILARVSLVKAFDPKIIFVSCGINDLKLTVNPGSSIVTGVPYAADARQVELPYVEGLYAQLLAALENTGATVFVMGISSPNGAGLVKSLAQRTMSFNRWLKYKCDQSPNTHYLDVDRVTYDPMVTTGEVLSGYYVSDGIHKSITGAFNAGQRIAAKIKPLLAGNLVDRLPWNIMETHPNMAVTGTAFAADGANLVVTINNLTGSFRTFQPGDRVCFFCPVAGHADWDGAYTISSVTDASVTMPCTLPAGSYTGTVKISNATQMFANPLFTTQTGGGVAGGCTLTSGNVPGLVTINGNAGTSSVTVTYAAHTDLDGVADGLGSWAEFALVGGANASVQILLATAKSNPATSYSGRIFPGDTINACGDLDVVTPVGVYSLQAGITLNYYDAGGNLVSGTLESLYRSPTATEAHPNLAFRGSFQTCDWKLPSAPLPISTGMTVDGRVLVLFGAGGGTCTVRLGRFGIIRVDDSVRDASTPACYQ